jgi:ferredoxin-NADP reductase
MSNYKYYLKNIARPNNNVVILELADITGRPVFAYKSGQYVMISYLDKFGKINQRHAFSLVSSPTQNKSLILGIKIEGPFTSGLLNLKIGDPISVSGPYGKFIFNPKKHKNLVLLAGGIGITPFLSTLSYATDNNLANKLTLLYSVHTLEQANFLNKIKQLETRNPNLKTLLAITNEQIMANTPGVINQRIDGQVIQDFIGDVYDKTFFICGPVAFMEVIKNSLLSLGVKESRISLEAFSMINDKSLWPQFRNLLYATGFSAAVLALVFFSITNSLAATKSLKPVNSSLNSIIDNSASSLQNQTAPTPVTSVSGIPSTASPTNNSNNFNNQQINKITIPTNSNQLTVPPQPTTSSSLPARQDSND